MSTDYKSYIEYNSKGELLFPNIKKIFIPDEGMEIFDADLSGADIQVVAADAEARWLLDFFAKPQEKKVYAYIASEFFQRDISDKSDEYKMYKGIFHGCVTGDHEVLTREGWVRLDEYDEKQPLAIWSADNFNIFFEAPKGLNKDFVTSEEALYSIRGSSFSFLGTQDHKFPYVRSSGKIAKVEAAKLNKTARIPYSGNYIGGDLYFDNDYIRLIVALQADGTITHIAKNGDVTYSFRLVKSRKIARLKQLLQNLNINYSISQVGLTSTGNEIFNINFKNNLQPWMKQLDWYILDWSKENLEVFVEELQYWDGHVRKGNGVRTSISTVNKKAAEIIQTIIHLTGKGSKIITYKRDGTRKTLYQVSINNRKYFNLSSGQRYLVYHKGTKVYCPQTSTGYFVCRRDGHIYISSNTNYLMGVEKLALTAGIPLALARGLKEFYFYLNPEIPLWHERLQKDIKYKGFVSNAFGRRMWFLNKNNPNLMNEVAAAIPQSTIGDVINRAWIRIRKELPELRPILMQTHDSLTGQYPYSVAEEYRKRIPELMQIQIPYKHPLYISADIKVSRKSYGDAEKVK